MSTPSLDDAASSSISGTTANNNKSPSPPVIDLVDSPRSPSPALISLDDSDSLEFDGPNSTTNPMPVKARAIPAKPAPSAIPANAAASGGGPPTDIFEETMKVCRQGNITDMARKTTVFNVLAEHYSKPNDPCVQRLQPLGVFGDDEALITFEYFLRMYFEDGMRRHMVVRRVQQIYQHVP